MLYELNALCLTYSPHVICVLESWLSLILQILILPFPTIALFDLTKIALAVVLLFMLTVSYYVNCLKLFIISLTQTFAFIKYEIPQIFNFSHILPFSLCIFHPFLLKTLFSFVALMLTMLNPSFPLLDKLHGISGSFHD